MLTTILFFILAVFVTFIVVGLLGIAFGKFLSIRNLIIYLLLLMIFTLLTGFGGMSGVVVGCLIGGVVFFRNKDIRSEFRD